jgi:two-component system, OmpR family, phosphate regulon sensor histidine kinase PhoR
MDYSLLIAQTPLVSDNNLMIISIIVTIIAAVTIFIILFVRKIRENEHLKNEFITIIAHKFRTPLTQTRWLTESLIAEESDQNKKENLTEMLKVNRGLIDMTGSLIELTESDSASKASYAFERVSLCDLVRSVGEPLKESFHEKNIFFAVQCPPEDIFVKVDKPRMEFVLQTLLTNAYTYTPPGRNVDVLVSYAGNKSMVQVVDHGIGIDRADLPHIFSKFFRAPNAQRTDTEGFGVGLYLAGSIIRRIHGKIEVFSEGLNQGTTFSVTLPRVK